MNPVQETLDELASVFGLSGLRPNGQGVVLLQLGENDLLSLEFCEKAVLLCLARPVPHHANGLFERALRLCDARTGLPVAVRAGLVEKGRLKTTARNGENQFSDTLVLMTRFEEHAFRLVEVLQHIEILMRLHNRIMA